MTHYVLSTRVNLSKSVKYHSWDKRFYPPKDLSLIGEFKKSLDILHIVFTHTLAKKKLMPISWYCSFYKLYKAPENCTSFHKGESKFSGKYASTWCATRCTDDSSHVVPKLQYGSVIASWPTSTQFLSLIPRQNRL